MHALIEDREPQSSKEDMARQQTQMDVTWSDSPRDSFSVCPFHMYGFVNTEWFTVTTFQTLSMEINKGTTIDFSRNAVLLSSKTMGTSLGQMHL